MKKQNESKPNVRYVLLEADYFTALGIKRAISKLRPNYQLVGESTTIADSVKLIKSNNIDLIISDIQLADGLLYDTYKELTLNRPLIIFTGYNSYYDKFKEFNLVNYVLKPISREDIEQSLYLYETKY